MTENNKSGAPSLWLFFVFAFIMGVFANLLIVCPIKFSKWLKIDKSVRKPLFDAISPFGDGFISIRGLMCYTVYGVFLFFLLLVILNLAEGSFFKLGGAAIMLISIMTVGTFAISVWLVRCDINETDYETGELSDQDKADIKARREERDRIKKIEAEEFIKKSEKELNEIKIEKLPF